MTNYTPATIAKSLMAFITAFGGAAATSAPHDPVGWAGCAGAGLVAFAAVFATPNKKSDPTTPAEHVINNLPVVVQQANDALGELEKVKEAASGALGGLPLVQKLLAGVK